MSTDISIDDIEFQDIDFDINKYLITSKPLTDEEFKELLRPGNKDKK